MGVSLTKKGQSVSLKKGINNVLIGLGWDTSGSRSMYAYDLDASVFLVGSNGKVRHDGDFVFHANEEHESKSVIHTGDNRTGEGDGDDEQIKVNLDKVPLDIEKLIITVTIYQGKKKGQNFGQISNAFVRLVDESTGSQELIYNLTEDCSTETALVFAELYRTRRGWDFRALGETYICGLEDLCAKYGVSVEEDEEGKKQNQ